MHVCMCWGCAHACHHVLRCVTRCCLQNLSSFAHNTSEYKAKAKQYNQTIQDLGRLAGYVASLVMLLCAAAKPCCCDVSISTELYAYVCEGITCLWHRWTRASCSIVCLRTRAKVMGAAPAVTLFKRRWSHDALVQVSQPSPCSTRAT